MARLSGIYAVALWLLASGAQAADYAPDYDSSTLSFSGAHADTPFEGAFTKWSARIAFDAADLAHSHLDVSIETASAKTGNSMYDGTLPTVDWFAAEKHPKARFISARITKKEEGVYTADGTLTIRGVSHPVAFDFALDPPDASTSDVTARFALTIDRLDYDIGKASDAKAEWVSREISFVGKVIAKKK